MVDGVVRENGGNDMSLERSDVLDRGRTENISGVRATSLYPPLGAMLHLGCLRSTDMGILSTRIIF
jgi:hypothetical protein